MIKIEEHKIKIRDLFEGYKNNDEEGVVGYGGKLDIRPKYQREFIYDDEEQKAVINSVLNGFPLNSMYWVHRPEDKERPYEVMDGQQRTISICNFIEDGEEKFHIDFREFSHSQEEDLRYYHNLGQEWKDKILNYELTVYICEGTREEKLKWFQTINIPGEKLYPQEILNAIYAGPFTIDAKRFFSKKNCAAYRLSEGLVLGKVNRQDYLHKALEWMADHETRQGKKQTIKEYMAEHQEDPNANNLWSYFQNVINWAKTNFDIHKFKPVMKGQNWAKWYDLFKDETLDTKSLASEISKLMKDGEVQKKGGIIPYVLTHDEQLLDLRTFPEDIALAVYEEQGHKCKICGKVFPFEEMEADHIIPWAKGGRTTQDNCQMLCQRCNRKKSDK